MSKLKEYENYLRENEKSAATVEKYLRDVGCFLKFTKGAVDKELVLAYKERIKETYLPKSVNSMLSSVNSYLSFIGRSDCRVKLLKIQRSAFVENVLTYEEYKRLLVTAKNSGKERTFLMLQTLCSTGIRVSELRFITVCALKRGSAVIDLKGKTRNVIIPKKLCRALLKYVKKRSITDGSVFVTKNGSAIDRSNIWREMKALCEKAGVDEKKVFPHNLRHLFARTFYRAEKDIVKLADILGHSSINTTRIYTAEVFDAHRTKLERLGLLLC